MRVLVVEDEQDTAEALSWGLTAEGYVVDVADNGVDGLWKATENAYDVIILDVMLPGLDGYQVAERLREAGPVDADPDAHRDGRRPGPRRGPGQRGGRLPAQAVLLPGPARSPALADPPHARRPAGGAGRGRPGPGPGGPHRHPGRRARRRVLITSAAGPDGIVVEIADDGPGVPAEERERVFGRFVRLDASREHASGSAGLGLAIAREIATAHGATIVLADAEGGGTRAVVTMGGTESAG